MQPLILKGTRALLFPNGTGNEAKKEPHKCGSFRQIENSYVSDLDGGRTRARTWDPLIKSQLLYQLS